MEGLAALQDALDYSGCSGPNFSGNKSLGKVGTTGFLLGVGLGVHATLVAVTLVLDCGKWGGALQQWSLYFGLLCLFHFLEFFTTAVQQPGSLGYSSFVVNHSTSYTLAALASWLEFWLETAFFPTATKRNPLFMHLGLALVVGGQAIRTWAMWTCGEHFDHTIMERRKEGHKLVTNGIYAVLRHPSYFGWFYWSVGTQVLLCNPICTVLYAFASWQFFNNRIPFEEETLLSFYRQAYADYMSRTWIGIPFVRGYLKPTSE